MGLEKSDHFRLLRGPGGMLMHAIRRCAKRHVPVGSPEGPMAAQRHQNHPQCAPEPFGLRPVRAFQPPAKQAAIAQRQGRTSMEQAGQMGAHRQALKVRGNPWVIHQKGKSW